MMACASSETPWRSHTLIHAAPAEIRRKAFQGFTNRRPQRCLRPLDLEKGSSYGSGGTGVSANMEWGTYWR